MAALLIAFRQKTLLLQDEFKIVSVKRHPWEIRGAVFTKMFPEIPSGVFAPLHFDRYLILKPIATKNYSHLDNKIFFTITHQNNQRDTVNFNKNMTIC